MRLDGTFSQEISKVANGDGSREAKFSFVRTVKEVKRTLSTVKAPYLFEDCIRKFGRVPVAVCVASTIIDRRDRLKQSSYLWALAVMRLYTNAPHDKGYALIDDGLHPTRIEEYAGAFIRSTIMQE